MNTEKKVILIIGKRGSGKSFLTQKLIAKFERLLIFDIMSEYTSGIVFGTETQKEFSLFWSKTYRSRFRIIYRPIEPKKEIDYLARLVFALGNMAFVLEEIDSICTAYDLPETFSKIIYEAGKRNLCFQYERTQGPRLLA
jgi:hypothetical protein